MSLRRSHRRSNNVNLVDKSNTCMEFNLSRIATINPWLGYTEVGRAIQLGEVGRAIQLGEVDRAIQLGEVGRAVQLRFLLPEFESGLGMNWYRLWGGVFVTSHVFFTLFCRTDKGLTPAFVL